MRIIGDSLIWIRDFAKDDDRIKFIFDNVRNFIVSGLVIAAGFYEVVVLLPEWQKHPLSSPIVNAFFVAFTAVQTTIIIVFGATLLLLNSIHAARTFVEMTPPLGIKILITLVYTSITVLVTATVISNVGIFH